MQTGDLENRLGSMEQIELKNYRCFEHLKLSFRESINLLIGDNSSGKTTIIKALSTALNSFFVGYSDDNTRFVGLDKDDFTIKETNTGLANDLPISINFRNLNVDATLELHSRKGRTLQKPLYPISALGIKLYSDLFNISNEQVRSLPLFAGFSTNDIHAKRSISLNSFTKYALKPSFGYYECMQGDGFLPYWTKRLLVLKEAGKGEIEIEGVKQAIVKALGHGGCNIISGIDIRHNQGKVYYLFTDGREVEFENLSDGYLRLVNIVVDIAFRCMLLNQGIFGLESCNKTTGTVLIDEIDLHLHPTLQSLVLKGLKNAFPLLQFMITTHAPMVMTGIPAHNANIIYLLEFKTGMGYSAVEKELYGLDASTILEIALNTIPRYKEVDDRLNQLFSFIDDDKYNEALSILKNMREEFSDRLPELAKAEAMLNFLSEPNDKNK